MARPRSFPTDPAEVKRLLALCRHLTAFSRYLTGSMWLIGFAAHAMTVGTVARVGGVALAVLAFATPIVSEATLLLWVRNGRADLGALPELCVWWVGLLAVQYALAFWGERALPPLGEETLGDSR